MVLSSEHRKMRTFSGNMIDIFNPDPRDISIADIAHHLSLTNRFGGATPEGYTVAQHSVLVAKMADTAFLKLLYLLHDGHEAYMGDIPRPIKHTPEYHTVRMVEDILQGVICRVLIPGYEEVGEIGLRRMEQNLEFVDARMCATEARSLMGWKLGDSPRWEAYPEMKIECWPPRFAEMQFLTEYYRLIRM